MSLDFSWFADDMVLEILGHLPALDIIRYRRVCRRIYLASKERTVWTNALYRAKCPLPLVDVNSTPTEELERILVRMEIIHAKWTGARRTSPRVYRDFTGSESDPFQHSTVLCAMGPYIVCARNDRNGGRTTWYHKDNLLEKVAEHLSQLTVCRFFQSETGTFYISEMGSRDSNAGPRKIKLIKYQITGKDNCVAKTLDHEIDWQNAPSGGDHVDMKIQGGYLMVEASHIQPQTITLVHFDTGKVVSCPGPVQYDEHPDDNPWLHFTSRHITSSHLIRAGRTRLTLFKLPSKDELQSSDSPIVLQKTHVGALPREFHQLNIFQRSGTSFAVVGLIEMDRGGPEPNVQLQLLTIDLDEYSSVCYVREDDTYEVKGYLRSFHLSSCPASSPSILGLLSVVIPAATHTSTGRRIARRSRAATVYILGVSVTFGRRHGKPEISLMELDLLPNDGTGRIVAHIKKFDPYSGTIILEEQESEGHHALKLAVVDVSP